MSILQLGIVWTLATCLSVQATPESDPDSRTARALVGALRAYDATIQSLEWRSVAFQPGAERGGGWTPTDFLVGGFDDIGRWYMQNQFNISPDPGSRDVSDFSLTFRAHRGDAARMLYFDICLQDGKIADPAQPEFLYSATPRIAIGRRSDLEQGRTLAELLATGEGLRLWSSPDHPGLPGVEAMATHGVHRFRVRAVLDPEHGYAPRAIRTFRPTENTPMETMEVVRFSKIEGIWLASVSLHTFYLFVDVSPGSKNAKFFENHKQRLEVLPRLLGVNIPDDLRAEIAAVMPRMMDHGPVPGEPNEIYAPMGAGMTKGAYTPLLLFVTPRSINKPLDPNWLNGPMRQDAMVYDFTRDRRCTIAEAAAPPEIEREVSP